MVPEDLISFLYYFTIKKKLSIVIFPRTTIKYCIFLQQNLFTKGHPLMGTNVLTFVKNLVAFRLFPYKMSRLFNIRLYSIANWLS